MRIRGRILAACCLAIFACGCATSSQPPAVSAAPGREPLSQASLVEHKLRNDAFCEWHVARMASACDQIAARTTSPQARYEALRLKASQASAYYAIVTGTNPLVQILNLNVLLQLTYDKWITEDLAEKTFGPDAALLKTALDESVQRNHATVMNMMTVKEYDALSALVVQWRAANPQVEEIDYIRFADFAKEMSKGFSQDQSSGGFFDDLRSTAEGVFDARMLGERALFLASRLPRVAAWNVEAQIAGTMIQVEKRMGDVTSRMDGTLAAMASLEKSVDRLRQSVASLEGALSNLGNAYSPETVEHLVRDSRDAAFAEVRTMVYRITICLAALILFYALLKRFLHGARPGSPLRTKA